MRLPIALAGLALLARSALADCPPDCVAGGGPATTDCFIAWGGITSMTVSCIDGDACDTDGKADGVCTFGLQACINVPGLGACQPSGLDARPGVKPARDPAAQQLASALGALDPAIEGCTPPGVTVPLRVSLAGIKPGTARLLVTASSGGKRDKDKLRLTCLPSTTPPSLSRDLQPIFGTGPLDNPNGKCTFSGCHAGFTLGGGLSLEPGHPYAETVNVHSIDIPRLLRVKPRSLRGSLMARKLLGKGIPRGTGVIMPQGCPAIIAPVTECLSKEEIFTILSWIANGAPDN